MKNKFYNDDNEKICALCEYGKISPDNAYVLCLKRGVMKLDSSCRKFKYDPFKREPRRANSNLPKYDPKEFEL